MTASRDKRKANEIIELPSHISLATVIAVFYRKILELSINKQLNRW